jgi:hypothetical protein
MKALRCMSFTSKGTSEILVAGEQDQMFVIDVEKGIVVKQVDSAPMWSKALTKRTDAYERLLYENETMPVYLRCYYYWICEYTRFNNL